MSQPHRTKINANGRIVIPARMRKEMGVKAGDEMLMRMKDGELHVYTLDHAIESFRRELAKHVPPGVSLVDELIRDRRAEAAMEEAETKAMLQYKTNAARRT